MAVQAVKTELFFLTPFTAIVFMSLGILVSTFIFNPIFMAMPVQREPVKISTYFKGPFKTHLNIQLAVIYDQIPGVVFSDAANKAIVRGKPLLIKENWWDIFEPDNVMEQIKDIT